MLQGDAETRAVPVTPRRKSFNEPRKLQPLFRVTAAWNQQPDWALSSDREKWSLQKGSWKSPTAVRRGAGVQRSRGLSIAAGLWARAGCYPPPPSAVLEPSYEASRPGHHRERDSVPLLLQHRDEFRVAHSYGWHAVYRHDFISTPRQKTGNLLVRS